MTSAPQARAAERYQALIEQLGDELGKPWGWKSAVARKLGVRQPYVGMILSGKRAGIGMDAVERAIARLGIRREFFFGDFAETPHYRDFLKKKLKDSVVEPEQEIPNSILRAIEYLGDRLSQETIDQAMAVRWGEGEPDDATAITYLQGLEARRAGRGLASDRRAADEETARADDELRRSPLKRPPKKKKR